MTDAPEADTLQFDVQIILLQCHRDRVGDGILRDGATEQHIVAFAAELARRLAPRIGGRYVPKRDVRAERDAAVVAAFNGRNRAEVMARFSLSRRLFYSILSRRR